jgi:hemerythrin-like domain-containing protein
MQRTEASSFSLNDREGLPQDLLQLCVKYPRESWNIHPNLGERAKFWLSRHEMFREVIMMLEKSCQKLSGDLISVEEFSQWFIPRLSFLLNHLDLHHEVEEFHLFPIFAAAEPKLMYGFSILESDHQSIHLSADSLKTELKTLFEFKNKPRDEVRRTGENSTNKFMTLSKGLMSHLYDEEDLIVPIVLDHSEEKLGLI